MDIQECIKHIKNDELRVLIKANAQENKILDYDEEKKAVIISISAPAENNKANKELIRFLSKLLKKKVLIKSGANSKQKVLKML